MRHYNGFTPGQRQAAFEWLKTEIAAGRRASAPERPCDACGSTAPVVYHSEDYSYPYGDHIGEFALCFPCHMMIHCRFRNPDLFRHYRALVQLGHQPVPAGNWRRFTALFLKPGALGRSMVKRRPAGPDTFAPILARGREVQHGRKQAQPHPEGPGQAHDREPVPEGPDAPRDSGEAF